MTKMTPKQEEIAAQKKAKALEKGRKVRVAKARKRTDDLIWETMERRLNRQPCGCDLRYGMTTAELRAIKGCQVRWICENLNAYRRYREDPRILQAKRDKD